MSDSKDRLDNAVRELSNKIDWASMTIKRLDAENALLTTKNEKLLEACLLVSKTLKSKNTPELNALATLLETAALLGK